MADDLRRDGIDPVNKQPYADRVARLLTGFCARQRYFAESREYHPVAERRGLLSCPEILQNGRIKSF